MGILERRAQEKAERARLAEIEALPWVRHPAPIDDTFGEPGAAAFAYACKTSDWRAAHETLASLSPDAASRAFGLIEGATDPDTMFDEWVRQMPDDPLAYIARASHRRDRAWAARGGGYAESVDPAAWDTFHQLLRDAVDDAHRAIDLDPTSPLPYPVLIWAGLGLSMPKEEIVGLFDRCHARSRFFPAACSATLQALAPKWGGSEEEMFGLARMAREGCPPGHTQHVLIVSAHIEMALAQPGDEVDFDHLRRPDVHREIRAAAEASIFAPGFVRDAGGLAVLNTFLFCFYLQDDRASVRWALDELAGRFCRRPWQYLGDPGRLVAKCCSLNGWTGPGAPPP